MLTRLVVERAALRVVPPILGTFRERFLLISVAGKLITMSQPLAVLQASVLALAQWPDGQVGAVWEMPSGTMVEVCGVTQIEQGFAVRCHPVGGARGVRRGQRPARGDPRRAGAVLAAASARYD